MFNILIPMSVHSIFFNKWTRNVSEPLRIVNKILDPIKDLILLSRMMVILGGPWVVYSHPELFSSCVSDKGKEIISNHLKLFYRLSYFYYQQSLDHTFLEL